MSFRKPQYIVKTRARFAAIGTFKAVQLIKRKYAAFMA